MPDPKRTERAGPGQCKRKNPSIIPARKWDRDKWQGRAQQKLGQIGVIDRQAPFSNDLCCPPGPAASLSGDSLLPAIKGDQDIGQGLEIHTKPGLTLVSVSRGPVGLGLRTTCVSCLLGMSKFGDREGDSSQAP